MSTISDFEVQRYLGQWHQVAAIPAWFQSECVAHATASYALGEDGLIEVLNSCETADGSRKQAEARARFLASRSDGRLEVTFVEVLGFWVWLAAGDYWIIGLHPEYQWSVVGHPSRDFAWVLTRSPSLDVQTLREIGQILEREAYDTCELLVTTPQQQGRLCDVTR
jgi:apolipoprotein D and lipocalin family protein